MRIGEPAIHRLDTSLVGRVLTLATFGFSGAALGLLFRSPALTAGALTIFTGIAYLNLWRHRLLPLAPGLIVLAAAGLVAGLTGAGVAALLDRARTTRPARIAMAGGVAALLLLLATTIPRALGDPPRPHATPVAVATREPSEVKVLLLALDGLDANVFDDARRAGRLPHLGALAGRGVRGDLRSIRPPKSPVVWTSVVTGVLPRVHGIRDFVTRREGARIPVSGDLRRVPALWDLGTHVGFTTGFVNWYVSWPAEGVRGIVISDRADFAGLERRVTPIEMEAVVDSMRAALDVAPGATAARFLEAGGDSGRGARLWGQNRRAEKILADVIRHDRFTMEGARLVLERGQPDLTAVYLRGADNTQHLFWKYRLARNNPTLAKALYGEIPPEEIREYAAVVDRYYEFLDENVGVLLSLVDANTAILVTSDHGFLANNERGHWYAPNRLLAGAGLAALVAGGGGEADSAASLVYDPEPASIDAKRRLRGGGRAADKGGARAALEVARGPLLAARTDRGDAIVTRFETGEDERGPFADVTFHGSVGGDAVVIGEARVPRRDVIAPEGHSGDHRMDGMLIAAGSPFRERTKVDGARAVDLAPTVLHLLGAPVAADFEGVILEGLFTPEWKNAHPPRVVESYGKREAGTSAAPTAADERIREELEALGYIR